LSWSRVIHGRNGWQCVEGAQRNVYVREDDRALWEWATAHAKAHRWTTSAVVMMALEKLRDEVEGRTRHPRRRS
jgi:hypothetical protein